MAADLHIHVFKGIDEKDLAAFFSNTLGSKWFKPHTWDEQGGEDDVYSKISDTPNVWVGEVSWLKAALFADSDSFVPDAIGAISELVGEDLPVIDDKLIDGIKQALGLPNNTARQDGVMAGAGYAISDENGVIAFLEQHRGERVFTVSW